MKISAISFIAAAAAIAPALAAKTWDVNVVDGKFSPQELVIAPGDSVRWPLNDGPDHAIVETVPGARSCNNKPGGFNSGRKTKGQAYQRTFANMTTVNYKDGIGANCLKGEAMGSIYVGTQPSHNGTTATPTSTGSATAEPIVTPTSSPTTEKPNTAGGFLTPERTVLLGAVGFIGALLL